MKFIQLTILIALRNSTRSKIVKLSSFSIGLLIIACQSVSALGFFGVFSTFFRLKTPLLIFCNKSDCIPLGGDTGVFCLSSKFGFGGNFDFFSACVSLFGYSISFFVRDVGGCVSVSVDFFVPLLE